MRLAKWVGVASVAMLVGACGGHSTDSQSTASATSAVAHQVSGTVSHLEAVGLTLTNGNETISVDATSGTFSFSSAVTEGSSYEVTIASHPATQHCEVTNGAGKMAKSDAGDVVVSCHKIISQPTTVGVYATQTPPRVFLPLTMIGDHPVKMNTILDTGSSGALLNATQIFPSAMFDSHGDFIFADGKDKLTWKGITVTKVRGHKDYGHGSRSHSESGYLGYAQITMGAHGELTSASVPILFVTSTSGDDSLDSPSADLGVNIVGINSELETVKLDGVAKPEKDDPVHECNDIPTSQCALLNPLRSMYYKDGVSPGFALGPFTLENCDISNDACTVNSSFKVGLDDTLRTSYSAYELGCKEGRAADSTSIKNCSMEISGVTVTVNGTRYIGNLVVDSGQPNVRVTALNATAPAIATGATVDFAFPTGFSYSFIVADKGAYSTYANSSAQPGAYSNAGIAFFFDHSMTIDFGRGQEGWK
jgi:hypothetical protein